MCDLGLLLNVILLLIFCALGFPVPLPVNNSPSSLPRELCSCCLDGIQDWVFKLISTGNRHTFCCCFEATPGSASGLPLVQWLWVASGGAQGTLWYRGTKLQLLACNAGILML